MEDKSISEILTVLNQMEAEDKAEDAQRRGRAKLKVVIEGFAELKKSLPPLEAKIAEAGRKLSGLNAEYAGKVAAKQKEADREIHGHTERMFTAKGKADEWTKKVTALGITLANAESDLKAELAKRDTAISEKQAAFDKLQTAFTNFQKRHGLQATG